MDIRGAWISAGRAWLPVPIIRANSLYDYRVGMGEKASRGGSGQSYPENRCILGDGVYGPCKGWASPFGDDNRLAGPELFPVGGHGTAREIGAVSLCMHAATLARIGEHGMDGTGRLWWAAGTLPGKEDCVQLGRRERAGDQVPLRGIAAEFLKDLELGLSFDSLGRRFQAEGFGRGITPATRMAEVGSESIVSMKDLSSFSPVRGRFRRSARDE